MDYYFMNTQGRVSYTLHEVNFDHERVSMSDIPNFERQDTEWQAWQDWHQEVTKLCGFDVNDPRCEKLVSLTKVWGEQLALLRVSQGERGELWSHKVINEELVKFPPEEQMDQLT